MRKLWEWIKRPHGWALLPLYFLTAVFIAAAIVFTVISDSRLAVLSYISYGLSAAFLGYSVYSIVILVPQIKNKSVEAINKRPFLSKLYGQYGFRTVAFTVISFAVSLAYAVYNGVIGAVYGSSWYGALGGYYALLTVIRGGILLFYKGRKKLIFTGDGAAVKRREAVTYAACGFMLVLLPVALSAVIAQTVASKKAFVHAGLMIYVSAAYTFYKIILSAVNFFKAKRHSELTLTAIRNVNLADALVSLLALQTAMFHEFSPSENFGTANAAMGAVVCAITAFIGLYMGVKGCIIIAKLRRNEDE